VYLVVVIIIIIAGVNKLLTSLSVVHVCVINLTTTVSADVAKLPSSKLLSDFLGCVAAFDTSLFLLHCSRVTQCLQVTTHFENNKN